MQLVVRRYFWTVYLVLLCAAGAIASQIARFLLESDPPISSSQLSQVPTPNPKPETTRLDTARFASLLGLSLASDLPAIPPPTEDQGPTRSRLGVKLIGTLSGVAKQWVLASLDVGGRARSFSIGDEVEGAKIIDIERDRVIVLNQSRQEFIDRGQAPESGRTSTDVPSPSPQGLGASIRALSPTEYEVPRAELDNIVADINTIATQARSAPVIKDGRVQGLRLFAIRPGSIYERLGISNGDVLTRINGENLDSMTKGLQLFTKLQEARRIEVDLERSGSVTRRTYYVR
ncbi:MAG TPA: type II secretion system protein GspC [Myxococcaceae bacterium]|nr:type II secretion system protein GspC [Myxococcaceae bacterium]